MNSDIDSRMIIIYRKVICSQDVVFSEQIKYKDKKGVSRVVGSVHEMVELNISNSIKWEQSGLN